MAIRLGQGQGCPRIGRSQSHRNWMAVVGVDSSMTNKVKGAWPIHTSRSGVKSTPIFVAFLVNGCNGPVASRWHPANSSLLYDGLEKSWATSDRPHRLKPLHLPFDSHKISKCGSRHPCLHNGVYRAPRGGRRRLRTGKAPGGSPLGMGPMWVFMTLLLLCGKGAGRQPALLGADMGFYDTSLVTMACCVVATAVGSGAVPTGERISMFCQRLGLDGRYLSQTELN